MLHVLQVAALSAEEFGQLQHEYVVAFAEHLLLRMAPLHMQTSDDDRLVRMTRHVIPVVTATADQQQAVSLP